MKKYLLPGKNVFADFDVYIIEFHKEINYPTNTTFPDLMDIKSRRTLLQISHDLQELNNIQRRKPIFSPNYWIHRNSQKNYPKRYTGLLQKILYSSKYCIFHFNL